MEKRRSLNWIIGLATAGTGFIGIFGFILALATYMRGDATGAGICLTASALALGLLANAVLRQ
jgi:hypothetical protein